MCFCALNWLGGEFPGYSQKRQANSGERSKTAMLCVHFLPDFSGNKLCTATTNSNTSYRLIFLLQKLQESHLTMMSTAHTKSVKWQDDKLIMN